MIFQQYVYAVYWATATISTVGYGDVVAVSVNERIYNVLVFLVGTSVYAMAVVHLQDIVAQLNVTSGIFKSRCDRITAFLQREGVPEHVFAKVSLSIHILYSILFFCYCLIRTKHTPINCGHQLEGRLEENCSNFCHSIYMGACSLHSQRMLCPLYFL